MTILEFPNPEYKPIRLEELPKNVGFYVALGLGVAGISYVSDSDAVSRLLGAYILAEGLAIVPDAITKLKGAFPGTVPIETLLSRQGEHTPIVPR